MWFVESGLLRVGLSAQGLVLARGSARAADCRTIRCDGAEPPAEEPWRAALQALDEALARWPEGERPGRMEVVLSNQLLRWQLVDMPLQALTDEEQQALARRHFQNVYGPRSTAWTLRLAALSAGQPQPVCALDPALLEALGALTASHHIRLLSVAPYLSRAHDHWRRQLRAPSHWLVQLEPGALTLGLVLQRRWRALRCLRQVEAGLGGLPAQLAQLGLGAGWTGESLPLYLMNSSEAAQLARPELQITVLEPDAPALRTVPQARLAWGL